jgi:Spy/CpxP family protein refolding chaperone
VTAPGSRVLAVLTVVAMLAVGVFAGVAIDRTILHRRGDYRGGGNRGGGSGGPFGMMTEPVDTASRNRMRARIVKHLTDDLTLNVSQAHSVDSIFARRELQLDSLRSRVGPQLDSLRDQMRASINAVLTPEQRTKFDAIRAKMDARHKAEAERGNGPPRD